MKKGINQEDNQDIITELRKLPKVKDSRGKSDVYHRISSSMDKSPHAGNRERKRLLPVLATFAVISLIAFLPFMAERNSSDSSISGENESSVMHDTAEDSGSMEANMVTEQAEMDRTVPDSSYTVPAGQAEFQVVHGAFADPQNQYVIPVSFLTDPSESMVEIYADLDRLIAGQEWDMADYLLADADYQISETDGTVTLTLPEGFSLGEGSASAGIFDGMLQAMFSPYGINKAILQSEGEEKPDLGPFGETSELQIGATQRAAYKIYGDDLLIPIPMETGTGIEGAVEEMKIDEPVFNVRSAVPADTSITVQANGDELSVGLPEEAYGGGEKDIRILVDAILMTAKSYGYSQVKFVDAPVATVGYYDLTTPVPVPLAANPVDIR